MGRIVGLDYGETRLGFAVSDPTEMLSSSVCVSECRTEQEALAEVSRICREAAACKLVVGLPINMNGTQGPAAMGVMAFVEKVAKRIGIPVETWDERLTTKSAHDVLIQAGTTRKRRKGIVDKLAAQIMLQNYLDAKGSHDADAQPEG